MSPSILFSQSQITHYTVQLEPSHPVYSSAKAKSPCIQFTRAKSPSKQFSQSQVTLYTIQLEPSYPVSSSARAKPLCTARMNGGALAITDTANIIMLKVILQAQVNMALLNPLVYNSTLLNS